MLTHKLATITRGGESVQVLIHARDSLRARLAAEHAENNPVDGYILLQWTVRRRPKGGKLRFLTLLFRHTGTDKHPPLTDELEWCELMQEEIEVASGRACGPGSVPPE